MSDNTLQADWIILLRTNLDIFVPDFVAANLLWYPVRGNRKSLAPDVLVAFGRPKGYRGSYKSWEEGGIQPQVVFEIRSPSNSDTEMAEKFADYDRFGVEEYYHYDPHRNFLEVFLRHNGRLQPLPVVGSFDSPRLRIRFLLRPSGLQLLDPTGQPFRRLDEEREQREAAERQAESERQRAAQQEQRAAQQEQRAAQQEQRAERLAARLRALGLEEE